MSQNRLQCVTGEAVNRPAMFGLQLDADLPRDRLPNHDAVRAGVAECAASWAFDDATRTRVWDLFANGPAPVGYDPRLIPGWTKPTDDSFAALRLEPWRLRVFPGSVLMGKGGNVLTWKRA